MNSIIGERKYFLSPFLLSLQKNNNPMKKLLLFLIIVFLAFAGDAQNFFEKIIPYEDGIMR